jgi:RimJ/RimL family protein N-acetyltransferase
LSIERNGILLKAMSFDHLETVRNWRNSKLVRSNMIFKNMISEEQQLNWFRNLDTDCNIYMVIHVDRKPIGVCNLKNIDWNQGVGEGGIFIGEPDFLNSTVPIKVVMLFLDYLFNRKDLSKIILKILKSNRASRKFVVGFGAELIAEHTEHYEMIIAAESFAKCGLQNRYAFDAE